MDRRNQYISYKKISTFIHRWYLVKHIGFEQIIIILYKDIIINEKISSCYIITNNKKFYLYKKALEAFKKIITQNNIYELNFISITFDEEQALCKAIDCIFPKTQRFLCYFHYKRNIQDKLKKLGFFKKNNNNKFNNTKEFILLHN